MSFLDRYEVSEIFLIDALSRLIGIQFQQIADKAEPSVFHGLVLEILLEKGNLHAEFRVSPKAGVILNLLGQCLGIINGLFKNGCPEAPLFSCHISDIVVAGN